MRFIFTFILLIAVSFKVSAQGCPATNGTFATATLFAPNWITGCTNGTSCSGTPTTFDNRTTCQAITSMDACAPSPSCGTDANNASDLWFKFYATGTTATVSVNPSVSMKSAIQVFSVNQATPTCGSLVEIGCNLATSVSAGALVNLTGLVAGNLYYYRTFGSAAIASQRTGTFCFCGSAGLASSCFRLLPVPSKKTLKCSTLVQSHIASALSGMVGARAIWRCSRSRSLSKR